MTDRRRALRVALLSGSAWLLSGCHRSVVGAPSASSPANAAACVATASAAQSASLAAIRADDPVVTFDSAWAIIARSHWDTTYNGVNWRALRDTLRPRAAAAKSTGELRTVLGDMLGRLKQSHFAIIPREQSDAAPAASASADRSAGVGIALRYVDRDMLVASVRAGSRAEAAGVQAGWTLLAVDNCPVAPRIAQAATSTDRRRVALNAYGLVTQSLGGPPGDTIDLTFLDGDGKRRATRMAREVEPGTIVKFGNLPPINSQLSFSRVTQGTRTIGVIRFNIWMPVLTPQFNAAMDALRDTDGIILDLRGNFGGVGGMSMGIAGHFLDSALTIGTMRQRGVSLNFVANPQRVNTRSQLVTPYAGPLGIVVDELSISTTEIFAGGMQQLGRARVFGSQTAGQALPSVSEKLPNGDVLYHAIADFVSPSGKPIEGPGVLPDVSAPINRKALLANRDPALDAAVLWAAAAAAIGKRAVTP